MDSYDEVHNVKDGREISTPEFDVRSSIKFDRNVDDVKEDIFENSSTEVHVKPKLERLDSQQLQRSKKSFRKMNIDSIDDNNNLSESSSSKSDDDDDDDDDGAHQYLSSFPNDPEKQQQQQPPKFDYNFKQFENLDAAFPADLREIMQYIPKFSPQNVEIDYKLQVFIPEFFPSVGDIDAFLKIVTPEPLKAMEATHLNDISRLGLEVLDEPGEQSEEALLQIKLRSMFAKPLAAPSALVKSPKDIDKWIQEIQSLHASRIHDNLMQQHQTQINIDNLMTEWPDDVERRMESCYPSPNLNCTLSDYVKIICNLFDIPIENADNHYDYIRALNILFNLYIAIRKEK
ncbi:CLUMA_CG002147, isoform A [Clunio marinus]|uniref:Intraflagellar transport protein 46 homolog n=1 Tax=Clunio marinus TaxID=568069 RepID=A0A1J1HLF0_9DIPT|nr:CLUMA_CG002147, isoform A [Clunio marinus]